MLACAVPASRVISVPEPPKEKIELAVPISLMPMLLLLLASALLWPVTVLELARELVTRSTNRLPLLPAWTPVLLSPKKLPLGELDVLVVSAVTPDDVARKTFSTLTSMLELVPTAKSISVALLVSMSPPVSQAQPAKLLTPLRVASVNVPLPGCGAALSKSGRHDHPGQ